jgi:3D (Asp-Asp-Asp) domain-containing protein
MKLLYTYRKEKGKEDDAVRRAKKCKSLFTKILIALILLISLFTFLNEELQHYIPEWENNLSLEQLIKLHKYTLPKAPEGYVSIGTFKLTAYCPCAKCCGKWGENRPTDENGVIVITSSGERAKANYTLAADTSLLPFGTMLLIDGMEYRVQDRGSAIQRKHLDVYFDDHNEALKFGVQYKEIYIKADIVAD